MTDRPFNVLFLCTGNSARSIIAEAILNKTGRGQFRAYSAGGAPPRDFVFTVCDNAAGETCPVWPGQPMTAHWGIPDPAAATGSDAEIALAFKDAYRMLFQRIGIFTALPIRSLDRLSLQQKLRDIGRVTDEAATERT